jgi:hypothetical protein
MFTHAATWTNCRYTGQVNFNRFGGISNRRFRKSEKFVLNPCIGCWPVLTMILAVPWMVESWKIGPVFFARQRPSRRFALGLCKKHPAQIVPAVYRV